MPRTRSLALTLALLGAASPAFALDSTAWVLQTDYASGELSRVALATRTMTCDVEPVGADPQMRWYDGRVYVVNRAGGDNIQVVNPATNATTLQFSVGNGANPYDIAFASPTKAYVTRYERTDLWIVNPATGAFLGAIPLAAFADADGIPEMDHLIAVGPLLFVSIQRLDRNGGFQPTDYSLVAVIDMRTDTLVDCDPMTPGVQAIRLEKKNPATKFQFDKPTSRLLVGCAGRYTFADGGIEWIDPVALTSGGVAMTEAALGGDVLDVVWTGAAKSYAVVSDAAFNTSLIAWSPQSAAPLDTLFAPGGFSLSDAEVNDRDELYVCFNDFVTPAVHVFSTTTGQPIGGPLACRLPPVALAFDVESGQVAGAPPAQAGPLALAAPWPNPARGPVEIALGLPAAGEVRLEVFDLAGRRLRTLADGPRPAGLLRATWDLADGAGVAVRPGLYMVRATAAGRSEARPIVVTR